MSDTDSNYDEREQSEIKHYALRLYLEPAARILGTTRSVTYVDCCAGPWKACAPDCSDTSFGIATDVFGRAAAALAGRGIIRKFPLLLIEKDMSAFRKLEGFAKQHSSQSLLITARNWDFTEKLSEIIRFCSGAGGFPFIFIDPTGWKLAETANIRPLLHLNPGEVLINLMSPFISRFIKDNKTDFSGLLGEDYPSLRSLQGAELEQAIVDKYCDLIKREGNFAYVCSLPIMNPDMDSFNFHLIYATRSRKGVEVFKEVEKRTEKKTHEIRAGLQQKERESRSGNLELFEAGVQYHETCHQRLARTNKGRARDAVKTLIETANKASYDDCWVEALQFSAVYETDLRAWINDWEREGLIVVEGRALKARVLQVGKGVNLVRSAKQRQTYLEDAVASAPFQQLLALNSSTSTHTSTTATLTRSQKP